MSEVKKYDISRDTVAQVLVYLENVIVVGQTFKSTYGTWELFYNEYKKLTCTP